MAFLQLVVGDLRAEVMDVMETDVTREPLQDLGELVEGAAIHTGLEELPILVAFPIGRLKVMLYVEQPHARAASHEQNGDLNQQICLPADVINSPADKGEEGDVRPDHAVLFAYAGTLFPKAVTKREDDQRANSEQDEWISHDAIAKFFMPGGGEIFIHRHGVDITNAATVKITGSGVMNGMGMFPCIIRNRGSNHGR